jgi:hypothetical protein
LTAYIFQNSIQITVNLLKFEKNVLKKIYAKFSIQKISDFIKKNPVKIITWIENVLCKAPEPYMPAVNTLYFFLFKNRLSTVKPNNFCKLFVILHVCAVWFWERDHICCITGRRNKGVCVSLHFRLARNPI